MLEAIGLGNVFTGSKVSSPEKKKLKQKLSAYLLAVLQENQLSQNQQLLNQHLELK